MQIEIVLQAGAIIGESPTWAAHEKTLYWIDVKKPALYRFDPETQDQKVWPMPSDIGAFALVADPPGAIVALREGIFLLDFASKGLQRVAPPPFDPELFRFNEGACDVSGRFWVGVMFDPLTPVDPPQSFSLHSFTLQGGLRPEPDAAELHNGMAWSFDNRLFYIAHSQQRKIYTYRFDRDGGYLSGRELFADVPKELGLPDGAAIDREGGYWCALHGGGKLRRYHADSSIDKDIDLPVSQPTMCAFGGENCDELYVTSASGKLDAGQRKQEPLAGALFRLRPGTTGIFRPYIVR